MKELDLIETTRALRDPWSWCQKELRRRRVGSRELGERTGLVRSTLRQLYSGSVVAPTYPVQLKIVAFLLKTRDEPPRKLPKHNPHSLPVKKK